MPKKIKSKKRSHSRKVKKGKITTTVRTTADLIVGHSERHLEECPHLKVWAHVPSLSRFLSPLVFAFAGVIVMLTAFYIVNSTDVASPAIVAHDATHYAAQQAFYTGQEVSEEMHAVAGEFEAAQLKIREAAIATELSRALSFLSIFLICGAIWYLHKQHGVFGYNRAGFRVRRIR